jgi:hypothetical protein
MSDDTRARLFRSRITPGLPDRIRRSFAALLLSFVTVGLAWIAQMAGWPREQVIVTASNALSQLPTHLVRGSTGA